MSLRKLLCFSLMVLAASGCYFRPETQIPMPAKWSDRPEPGDRLMLFLPGMGDRIGVFEREGMLELAKAYPKVTEKVVFVTLDAHFGYYPEGTLVERVREDVLARYPNYPVTLVGTSLGGFGAQVLARNFPERVDRLVLIAPYMGNRGLIRRVKTKGFDARPDDSDVDREALLNWQFLIEAAAAGRPSVSVLVGADDRLRRGIEILAEKAPQIEIIQRPGGHKWKVWKQLWDQWLAKRSAETGGD